MNTLRPLLLLLALLFAAAVPAQTELRTFQLHNREAAEMITILRPMVDPRGGISGTGYTLIVRSTPENLQEIEQLVRELDAALRNLLITVRRGELTEQERRGIAARGAVGGDSGKVVVGDDGPPRVRLYGTERRNDGSGDQRLRVLEGQWAHIQSGLDMPVPQRSVTQSGGGVVVQESIEYRDVSSGFEVRPRLSGERVTIDVRPFRARPAATGGGAIETASLITTVSGRVGEWIELGGVVEEREGGSRGITHSTKERDVQRLRTYIRIDTVE
ncbi:MAG: secretin N-terminal domain-containing protein [Pseudomonadota bacterium]